MFPVAVYLLMFRVVFYLSKIFPVSCFLLMMFPPVVFSLRMLSVAVDLPFDPVVIDLCMMFPPVFDFHMMFLVCVHSSILFLVVADVL